MTRYWNERRKRRQVMTEESRNRIWLVNTPRSGSRYFVGAKPDVHRLCDVCLIGYWNQKKGQIKFCRNASNLDRVWLRSELRITFGSLKNIDASGYCNLE